MIPEVGDDDYSCCKLKKTADKQPDNIECMQRNALAARPVHSQKISHIAYERANMRVSVFCLLKFLQV
jgi:hypothetical protein